MPGISSSQSQQVLPQGALLPPAAGAADDVAPEVINMSVDELAALASTWRPDRPWQVRKAGERWRDLPLGYHPAWFIDTQYRAKPFSEMAGWPPQMGPIA